ncbi:hypothetical protein J7K28_06305 [Candidatus Aerophobetes bacterium]|nr:hypothetical protein [Candidatus Aerophobetes bacterium]
MSKGYVVRFPVRKLNRKKDFKKIYHSLYPRSAGRGFKGISRRKRD